MVKLTFFDGYTCHIDGPGYSFDRRRARDENPNGVILAHQEQDRSVHCRWVCTLSSADKIVVLEVGMVGECSIPDLLCTENGIYHHIAQLHMVV